MSDTGAVTALAILCQKGCTYKKAQADIYGIVNRKRLELNKIRQVFKTLMQSLFYKFFKH
jgi:hypothetical protein